MMRARLTRALALLASAACAGEIAIADSCEPTAAGAPAQGAAATTPAGTGADAGKDAARDADAGAESAPSDAAADASSAPAAPATNAAAPAPVGTVRPLTEGEIEKIWEAFPCGEQLVLCVDLAGNILSRPGSEPRPSLKALPHPDPSDTIAVMVFGHATDLHERSIVINEAVTSGERLTHLAPADGGSETAQQLLLARSNVHVPSAHDFEIKCEMIDARPDLDGGTRDSTAISCGKFRIVINDQAPYHFEAMLLVPLVFSGTRKVALTPLAGTDSQVLSKSEDLNIGISVGLHYFPFGVRGGGAWAEAPSELARSSSVPRPVRALFDYAIKPWGLEIATGLDKPLFTTVQVGLAFEPVRGGSVSFGVAALQGDFLQPGWRTGMVFPSDQTLPVDRRYMFRPYIGFSISPEILRLLIDVLESARNIAPPPGRTPDHGG